MSSQFILFNGWISISTSPDEESFDELSKAVDELKLFIAPLQRHSQIFEIRSFNLQQILLIGGCHNHDVGYSDSIVQLLNKVAELAPNSYGLVYIRWPEDELNWNHFKVYKMARGKITIENDPFFSPCRPLIED